MNSVKELNVFVASWLYLFKVLFFSCIHGLCKEFQHPAVTHIDSFQGNFHKVTVCHSFLRTRKRCVKYLSTSHTPNRAVPFPKSAPLVIASQRTKSRAPPCTHKLCYKYQAKLRPAHCSPKRDYGRERHQSIITSCLLDAFET